MTDAAIQNRATAPTLLGDQEHPSVRVAVTHSAVGIPSLPGHELSLPLDGPEYLNDPSRWGA